MAIQTNVVRAGNATTQIEAGAVVNATEIKVQEEMKNQAKGTVSVSGPSTISSSFMGVLEKFSKKIKLPIEVIFFDYQIEATLRNRPIVKDKIMIFCPVEVNVFRNTYPVSLRDITPITPTMQSTTASTSSANNISCSFLVDQYAQNILVNTQFCPLYSDDSMGIHVAFAIKNEIVFHADFLSEKSPINDFLKKSIILSALKYYEKYVKEGALVQRRTFDRVILDKYIRFIKGIQTNSKTVLRTQMNSFAEEIRGHFRAIQNLEKKMSDAAALSASMSRRIAKNKHDTDPECVSKMLEPLLTQNKYKTFDYTPDGQSIIGYTHLIEIEHHSKKYKIGEFKVTVKLDGCVMMENLTSRYSDGGSYYDHPHVHDKFPCLGNIKEQVMEMIKNFNFLPLFDLLYVYLCTYINEEGARPFIVLKRWSSAPWCDTCDRPREDCECRTERCSSCEEPRADCECERCPSSGSLMDNVDCDSCEHQNDEGECTF